MKMNKHHLSLCKKDEWNNHSKDERGTAEMETKEIDAWTNDQKNVPKMDNSKVYSRSMKTTQIRGFRLYRQRPSWCLWTNKKISSYWFIMEKEVDLWQKWWGEWNISWARFKSGESVKVVVNAIETLCRRVSSKICK